MSEPIAFPTETPTPLERLTVAVRICQDCKRVFGVLLWRGKDAHLPNESAGFFPTAEEGTTWCPTHGRCDRCEKLEQKRHPIDASDLVDADPHRLRADMDEVGGL